MLSGLICLFTKLEKPYFLILLSENKCSLAIFEAWKERDCFSPAGQKNAIGGRPVGKLTFWKPPL